MIVRCTSDSVANRYIEDSDTGLTRIRADSDVHNSTLTVTVATDSVTVARLRFLSPGWDSEPDLKPAAQLGLPVSDVPRSEPESV